METAKAYTELFIANLDKQAEYSLDWLDCVRIHLYIWLFGKNSVYFALNYVLTGCWQSHPENWAVFNVEKILAVEKVWDTPAISVRKEGSKNLLCMGTNEHLKYQNHCGRQAWEQMWHLFDLAGRWRTINLSWRDKTWAQILHFFFFLKEAWKIICYIYILDAAYYLCNGLFHLWLTEGRKCGF